MHWAWLRDIESNYMSTTRMLDMEPIFAKK